MHAVSCQLSVVSFCVVALPWHGLGGVGCSWGSDCCAAAASAFCPVLQPRASGIASSAYLSYHCLVRRCVGGLLAWWCMASAADTMHVCCWSSSVEHLMSWWMHLCWQVPLAWRDHRQDVLHLGNYHGSSSNTVAATACYTKRLFGEWPPAINSPFVFWCSATFWVASTYVVQARGSRHSVQQCMEFAGSAGSGPGSIGASGF